MYFTILGSGTSTGVPMVGCRCPVCTSSDPKDRRTRASLLVEHTGHHILVDTSTDLRKQAIRTQIPRIDAVLFTHAHADHIHGIDDLRGFHFQHQRVIPCFGTADTLDTIGSKFAYIFTGLSSAGYAQLLEPHVVDTTFSLFGLEIVPIPLWHGEMPATGYRFGPVAYLTDCSAIPQSSLALLAGIEVLIIDGLRYTSHPHHFNIAGAIEASRSLGPRRTIITHLTHEVPHRDGEKLPPGVELAYDGLCFTI
ncbi:MAG TPA: GPMC system MBL fold metallohydrolase [Geobacteraceae bacterium]